MLQYESTMKDDFLTFVDLGIGMDPARHGWVRYIEEIIYNNNLNLITYYYG